MFTSGLMEDVARIAIALERLAASAEQVAEITRRKYRGSLSGRRDARGGPGGDPRPLPGEES